MTNSNQSSLLTKKDFNQINRRSLFGFQLGWNYERMQGSGYLYHILPQLRKIYGDGTPELKAMMEEHTNFFNTSNFFNTIVTGIDLAIEEKEGIQGREAVAGVKAGLMGSFAAIGDSLFASLFPMVFGALAASLGTQGNPVGVFIWVAANIVIMWFRWIQLEFAYNRGVDLVQELQGELSAFTDAATLMGVFMVGALVASMINVTIPFEFSTSGVVVSVQNVLDMIMPRIVPAVLVGFVYWLLGRKGMTSTKVIFIVLFLSIILSVLGILAKP